MILLINESADENMSTSLFECLNNKGVDCILADQNSIPFTNTITLFAKDAKILGEINFGSYSIDIKDINAVYTRFANSKIYEDISEETKSEINTERQYYLDTFLEHIDALVINKNKALSVIYYQAIRLQYSKLNNF